MRTDEGDAAVHAALPPDLGGDPPAPGSSNPRSVGRNSAVLLSGTLLARAAAFVTTIVLARAFDTGAFALILLAQATSQYLAMVVDFGLTIAGIRSVGGDLPNVRRTMGGVLFIRLLFGVMGVLAIGLAVSLLRFESQAQLVFVLFASAVAVSALDISWVAQGRQSVGPRALVLAGGSSLALLFLIATLRLGAGPAIAPLAQLVGTGIFVAAGFVLVVRRYGPPSWAGRSILRTIVATSLPIGLATLLAQVYYNLDLILLGIFRSAGEVATYGAAYKVIFGLLAFGWTYSMVVLPRFALAHNQGPAELRAELGLRLRHFAPAILPLAVGGAILAQPILVALFGPQFADGAAPFALLLLSVPLSSFGSLILYSLVAARRHWALPIGSACGAFVNVALNLLLIPRFGMMGAAWATIAAVSVVLAVAVMQARSFLPRFAWPAIVRLGIALTMLGVVVAATATRWLPLAVVLGGVAYLVALRAVAYWRAEELAAARLYLARMLQRGRSRDRP